MRVLLIADHQAGQLGDATAKALTAARQLSGSVDILVAGHNTDTVVNTAKHLIGLQKVLVADAAEYDEQRAEPMADLVVEIAKDYDAIIAPATTNGKNIMPRVAALLDAMQVSEIIEVVDASTFKRPIYAGNAIETVQVREGKAVITVRTASFQATGTAEAAPVVAVDFRANDMQSRFVENKISASERPDLTAAKIVISGGRALGSAEAFEKFILPVADKLGAAVGASRAAVDAGYAPSDWQVGQTGKVVSPELYIACGISGAIQHLAGMKDSRVIVAINSDPDAPIFQVADYGLVADVFTALPALEAAL